MPGQLMQAFCLISVLALCPTQPVSTPRITLDPPAPTVDSASGEALPCPLGPGCRLHRTTFGLSSVRINHCVSFSIKSFLFRFSGLEKPKPISSWKSPWLTEPSKILSSDGNPFERPIFRGRWDSYASCASKADQVLVLWFGQRSEDRPAN